MQTVTKFIFLGSKITADGDCSHEIKRHLLLGRKAMANLDSILKKILTHTCGIWKNGYRGNFLQGRDREADIENGCAGLRLGEVGMN